MRLCGYLVDERGSEKALQSILRQLKRENPSLELPMTASGERFSTSRDDLAELANEDAFFADYALYRSAEKLLSTYLDKLSRPRVHPRFGFLLETGRTYCWGFNLQNLPREDQESEAAQTLRGILVAEGDDKVLIDSDYGQIELVAFAHVQEQQFGVPSGLRRRINAGEDIHRLIAATVLCKGIDEVTKGERNSAKPVSFGRLGAMGAARLQQIAGKICNPIPSLEEVQTMIEAYHRLCPELDRHLEDEHDTGLALARALDLSPARYRAATGRGLEDVDPDANEPQAWLGWMLLKVLKEERPVTRSGNRPYEDSELDFFWANAQRLASKAGLDARLTATLVDRRSDVGLYDAARRWAGRRPVFTITGRLRANATFCGARNCIFQGAAADGAILGMWHVWRAGHKIVSFVHDQIVTESPADDRVGDRVAEIEALMRRGMLEILPGMLVKLESVVTRSLNKRDLDPRYGPDGAIVANLRTNVQPAN